MNRLAERGAPDHRQIQHGIGQADSAAVFADEATRARLNQQNLAELERREKIIKQETGRSPKLRSDPFDESSRPLKNNRGSRRN